MSLTQSSGTEHDSLFSRTWMIIVTTFIIAIAVQALILPLSPGAHQDMQAYGLQAYAALHHKNVYLYTSRYPYPPVWIWIVMLMKQASVASHVPFDIAIRAPIVLSEALLAVPLGLWSRYRDANVSQVWMVMLLGILNPLMIMVSALHGQFDAIALLFLATALYFEDSGKPRAISSLMLGISIALKGWPILFLPLLVFRSESLMRKAACCLLAAIPITAAMVLYSAYVGFTPHMITNVANYSSTFDFGWSELLKQFISNNATITIMAKIDIVAIAAVSIAFGRQFRSDVVKAASATILMVYAIAIKMSIQYLSWMCAVLPLGKVKIAIPMISYGSFAAAAYYFGVLFRSPRVPYALSVILFKIGQISAAIFTLVALYYFVQFLRGKYECN